MLKVTGQTTIATQPAKGALNHPTTGQDLEALRTRRAMDNVEGPATLLTDEVNDMSISAICPNQLQAAPAIVNAALDTVKQALQGQDATGPS